MTAFYTTMGVLLQYYEIISLGAHSNTADLCMSII
jgi:hypothetical protein